LTPEKSSVSAHFFWIRRLLTCTYLGHEKEGIPPHVKWHLLANREDYRLSSRIFVTADSSLPSGSPCTSSYLNYVLVLQPSSWFL
jgi:hypothetical protein